MTIELTASVIVPTTILDTGAFTRSTTATYFDANGVMQTAPVDVPRIGYNPSTHAHEGLILEGAATNVLLRSDDMTNAASWLVGAGLGGFFTVTADSLPAPNGAVGNVAKFVTGATTSQGLFARQNVSVASGPVVAALYIYVPTQSGVTSWALVTDFGDSEYFISTTQTVFDSWVRVSGTTTLAATRTFMDFNIRRNGVDPTNGDGFTFYTVAADLHTGSVITSHIPTTSAQVTRAADIVTGSGLVYCTTAEPASGETLWNAATSYTVGQVAARTTTHHLYENLIAGVNATLPENATTGVTPRWLDLGATNRWSQFDQKIGTATTSTTSLTTIVKPGLGEGLALLDLIGVTAKISATDAGSGVVIFERTVDLDSTTIESVFDWMFSDRVQKRNVVITDIPAQYPNMVVAVTIESTTGSAIGVFAVGRAIFIGATEYGAGAGIINFGKVTDDGFGNRTWIEGDWANRVTLPMVGNTSDFNRIHRQLATVRSTPCIYIGSALDSMEPLVCYGVFRDLYITVPNYPSIAMNLEIDGMSNS